MKKISMKELNQMLTSDEELKLRLKNYIGEETDLDTIGEKTVEFFSKEGYDIDENTIELTEGDLENVSGGSVSGTLKKGAKFFRQVAKDVKDQLEVSSMFRGTKGLIEGFIDEF